MFMNSKNIVEQSIKFLSKPEFNITVQTALAYAYLAMFEINLNLTQSANIEPMGWMFGHSQKDLYMSLAAIDGFLAMVFAVWAIRGAVRMGKTADFPQAQAPIDNG